MTPYLVWPVEGPLTDRYGWRDAIPGVVGAQLHSGDDIAAPAGTPIKPAAPGRVTRKWWDTFANGAGAGGWMIEIDHGYGISTRYAHMQSDSPCNVGDWVGLDTIIGYVGSSGAATGAHLHYEVLINGSFVNPSLYTHQRLEEDMTPEQDRKLNQVYAWLEEVIVKGVPREGTTATGAKRTGRSSIRKFLATWEHQTGIDRERIKKTLWNVRLNRKSIRVLLTKFGLKEPKP